MKKLAFVFVLFLTTALVFGQQANYTSVIQNGNSNTADVLSQASTNGPNTLDFWQNGNSNVLTAMQSVEPAGSIISRNFSKGEQNGNSNIATVTQDGPINVSYLKQDGDYNAMTLKQYDSGSSSNVDNYAENVQSGNYNDYTLDQDGHLNTQKLWQTGDWNEAWIDQTAILSENYSFNYQNGNNNMIDLDQVAVNNNVGAINSSIAEQNGNTNRLLITQVGEYAQNTSTLLQTGDYNDTRLFQSTWYNNTSNNTVSGSGDVNYLKVSQAKWGEPIPF